MTYLWRILFTVAVVAGLAAMALDSSYFGTVGTAVVTALVCLAAVLLLFLPLELLCWKYSVEMIIVFAAPAFGYLLPRALMVFAPDWPGATAFASGYSLLLFVVGAAWAVSYISLHLIRRIKHGTHYGYPDSSGAMTDNYVRELGMLRLRKDATRNKG